MKEKAKAFSCGKMGRGMRANGLPAKSKVREKCTSEMAASTEANSAATKSTGKASIAGSINANTKASGSTNK